MKRYVERPNEQAFAPPYAQIGSALHGFALPAARERLAAQVERFLIEPSGGRLRARVEAEHVLVYFCNFARSLSLAPRELDRGWLGEREFGIWIPIIVPDSEVPTFMVHTMIVDSGPAMCSGRELLGLPKEIGLVGVPPDASQLGVDVLGFGSHRDEPGRWRPLLELDRIDARSDAPLAATLAHTLTLARELLGAPGRRGLVDRVRRAEAEFISLKQFRAADQPDRACYQALVRSRARLLSLQKIAASPSYAYRLHDIASHPLAHELGLARDGIARGISCTFDFELGHAQEHPT